jgi:transcriptional regulator with XRE-family HTH domain
MKSPLRLAREKRGMTLNALAAKVGSDVGNLSRIERGVQTPHPDLAERICKEFLGEVNELQLIYPSRYASAPEQIKQRRRKTDMPS